MDRWQGRVALVTGASAGIGAAIAKELVLKGMKVVAVARRVDRVEEYGKELKGASGELHPLKCDVTQEADILETFEWVRKHLGGVDVLVNNAGVYREVKLSDFETSKWNDVISTNLFGLSICSREALKSMKARGVDDGHIVHISSVCGHYIINSPGVGAYTASKFGVTALTEALRKELAALNSKIRVTSISPGLVRTEIMAASGGNISNEIYDVMPCLESKDIADAVVYVLGAPPHVQIHELTIRPTGEQ